MIKTMTAMILTSKIWRCSLNDVCGAIACRALPLKPTHHSAMAASGAPAPGSNDGPSSEADERLMMHLTGERFMTVFKAFQDAQSEDRLGLSLAQFANAISMSLPPQCWEELGEAGVSHAIMTMFDHIDVNGDVRVTREPPLARGCHSAAGCRKPSSGKSL
jgi:hypothetical protein